MAVDMLEVGLDGMAQSDTGPMSRVRSALQDRIILRPRCGHTSAKLKWDRVGPGYGVTRGIVGTIQ